MQMYFILVPLIHIHTAIKLSFLSDNDVWNIETLANSIFIVVCKSYFNSKISHKTVVNEKHINWPL